MPVHGTFKIAHKLAKHGGEVLDKFEASMPKEVFHYTDANGLIGILQNEGELWATDVKCMNDTGELSWGYSLLWKALAQCAGHPAHALLTKLLTHPAYVSGLVFAISFSEERDLLSQWRGYADNGAGFALGVASGELSKLRLDGEDPLLRIVRVEYNQAVQESRADDLVKVTLDILQPACSGTLSNQDEQMLVTGLGLIWPTLAVMCKNPGFSEEKEHRVVLRSHQDPILEDGAGPKLTMPKCLFRAGRYGVTPYVKVRLPKERLTDAIRSVVIGPRAVALETEAKVRTLLANAGIHDWSKFPIDRASVTYR